MIKKESLVCLILVLFVSIALVSSAEVTVRNVTLKENYTLGETLAGNFTLNVSNINANATLETNLGHSISLRNFLKNNSKQLDCEPYGCLSRYISNSAGFGSGNIQTNKIYGFKISEPSLVNSISDISFKINLNFLEMNQTPSSIKFFDKNLYWKYMEPSTNYNRFVSSGCFRPSGTSENTVILGSTKICEEISNVPATKRVLLLANFTLGSGSESPRIYLSFSKKGDSTFNQECNISVESEQDNSCVINYVNPIKEGTYTICAWKSSGNKEVKLYRQINSDSCGYSPAGVAALQDFSLFIKIPSFLPQTNNVTTIRLGDFLGGEEIKSGASSYLSEYYKGNCSNGCILPIEFLSSQSQVALEEAKINYLVGSVPLQSTHLFNLTQEPSRGSFSGIVFLENADFKLETSGMKTLEVYLKGDSSEKLFSKKIDVKLIAMSIRNILPLTLPAGVPSLIIANVVSSSKISSYQWTFGDGTTETTTENKVTKTYDNITTYNLTLRVTNNLSGVVEKSVLIETITPRDYLNSTLTERKKDIDNFRKMIDLLNVKFLDKLKAQLKLDELQGILNSIDAERTSATGEGTFLNLALRIQALEVPKSIRIKEKSSEPFIIESAKIDLSQVSAIGTKNLGGNKYSEAISNWQIFHVEGKKEVTSIEVEDSLGVKRVVARIYKMTVKSDEESYLIIQNSGSIEPSIPMQQTGNSKTLKLVGGQEKVIEFIQFGGELLQVYVFPEPSRIEVSQEVSPCNFNKICEKSLEEDYKNCRSDCKPWSIMIFLLVGLGIFFVVAYTFIQVYFKKRYEISLFKSEQELKNLVESILNSQENNVQRKEITDKLIKNGWSKEQVEYAFKKSRGERTRPYELIPMDKLMNKFNKKKE